MQTLKLRLKNGVGAEFLSQLQEKPKLNEPQTEKNYVIIYMGFWLERQKKPKICKNFELRNLNLELFCNNKFKAI
jgi:hypothetical protein